MDTGKDHAQLEELVPAPVRVYQGLQEVGFDRMDRFAVVTLRDVLRHFVPDRVRDGNAIAVEVHGERRHDVPLAAVTGPGRERLPGQHMGAIEAA